VSEFVCGTVKIIALSVVVVASEEFAVIEYEPAVVALESNMAAGVVLPLFTADLNVDPVPAVRVSDVAPLSANINSTEYPVIEV
jgi:hypothetical protein